MSTQNTEVRSSEIRALLNDTPSWFMKWGTAFILLAVISMGVVSWLVKYPDMVQADVTISNSNPPVPVFSPMKGILDKVFVSEGDMVEADEPLAVFTNPGSKYEDVEFLQAKLDVFNAKDPETFSEFEKYVDDPGNENDRFELGSIRTAFNEFIGKLRAYAIESAGNRNAQKIFSTREEILELKAEIKTDKERIPEYEKRLYLKKTTEKTEEDRYKGDNSITDPKPWRDAKNAASDAQAALDNFKLSIQYKESKVIQLGKEIKDLAASIDTDIARILNEIIVKQEKLDSEIKKWRQTYILYAPEAGKVSFYEQKGDKRKLFFEKGDEAMAILAEEKGALVGRLKLDKEYNGKVFKGDKVLMKLYSFPHHEYGKLKGEIVYIPQVPQENFYTVEVRLPNDSLLVTTFGKTIPFERELEGTAKIITEEKRFFQRIYERVF